MRLYVGDSWGALTVIDLRSEPFQRRDGAVTERRYETIIELECRCGKVFQVPMRGFAGKRVMRDCGCGVGASAKSSVISGYVDGPTADGVKRWAKAHKTNKSKAVAELLRRALRLSQS